MQKSINGLGYYVTSEVLNTSLASYLPLSGGTVTGTVTMSPLTASTVLKLNGSKQITSALIVDGDITNSTISDGKLASTVSSTATNNSIVKRDASAGITFVQGTCRNLVLSMDDPLHASAPDALQIKGIANANQMMLIGYNTTLNFGSIQCQEDTVAFRPLVLQPNGGVVAIGTTTFDPSITLSAISSNPATGNYGGRIVCGGQGTGDLQFICGLYNDGGTKKVWIGGHNNNLTAWAPINISPSANCFINESAGVCTIGSVTAGSKTLNVVGTQNVTSDISVGGSISVGAGTQTVDGTIRFSSSRIESRESSIWKRLPNVRYAVIASGGSISGSRVSYGITGVTKTGTGVYKVTWDSWTSTPVIMVTVEGGTFTLSYTVNVDTEVNVITTDFASVAADRTFQIVVIG